ncbi:MAG: 5'-deoxynucleotidase [Veillonella sp.]|uniref:5'-deoxynucleotidase n=1 Tax=Veillonella sp. TaxID=1926307 RepID=UPI0029035EEE|nr:5'-deoxynucleotidase [Veillonella sp.]MDU2904125.1 5'-deoxynucleotidase [Veillonella sp.]
MSSFFAFLKRMRFINRWSLMRNTETENIQEHSLEVAMVAHNLAALKNEYFGGNVDINKVAVIAMYHEVSEIFTGDMPAYMKCVNELKAGNDEFKEAHDSILAKLKALNMPEVDMFLETYMPALGKSLDELNYYEIK